MHVYKLVKCAHLIKRAVHLVKCAIYVFHNRRCLHNNKNNITNAGVMPRKSGPVFPGTAVHLKSAGHLSILNSN